MAKRRVPKAPRIAWDMSTNEAEKILSCVDKVVADNVNACIREIRKTATLSISIDENGLCFYVDTGDVLILSDNGIEFSADQVLNETAPHTAEWWGDEEEVERSKQLCLAIEKFAEDLRKKFGITRD